MDEKRAKRILRQHVATDRLLGADAVPMGEARGVERPAGRAMTELADDVGKSSGKDSQSPSQSGGSLFADGDRSGVPSHEGGRSHDEKQQILDALNANEVSVCTRCGLCEGRTQTVFGEGSVDAEVMFVGEGPGQNEDEQGRPFVGRAGQLLDKQIAAMGYRREEVFIANIVKCRPPNNRAPTPAEVADCIGYLRTQIAVIQPKAIITLGGPAMKALLGAKEGITRVRGTWHEIEIGPGYPPVPVMPTFHPAYLLRAYTPDNRKKVWDDLQKVMQLVGKPLPN